MAAPFRMVLSVESKAALRYRLDAWLAKEEGRYNGDEDIADVLGDLAEGEGPRPAEALWFFPGFPVTAHGAISCLFLVDAITGPMAKGPGGKIVAPVVEELLDAAEGSGVLGDDAPAFRALFSSTRALSEMLGDDVPESLAELEADGILGPFLLLISGLAAVRLGKVL